MQYFGADGLGSVRQMYNSSGQVIANHRYDPFGNTISQSGVGTSNYGFTGEWTDATGLEYLRARYYAPTQGRFVTRDMRLGDANRPASYDAWLYAYANPVNLIDPSGLDPQCRYKMRALFGPDALESDIQGICAGQRLREIIAEANENGAVALVNTFRDFELSNDWGDVAGRTSSSRLEWLLNVTRERRSLETLFPAHFRIKFGNDFCFKEEFRDSPFYPTWRETYPEIRDIIGETNQVGHFLTAVDLAYNPRVVYLSIAPSLDIGAPATVKRIDLGELAVIGHEKISDVDWYVNGYPRLWTYVVQTLSTTDTDIELWRGAIKDDERGDADARDRKLNEIFTWGGSRSVPTRSEGYFDPRRVGNSMQDLRLSLKGFRFAYWVKANDSDPPDIAAEWLRVNLTILPPFK